MKTERHRACSFSQVVSCKVGLMIDMSNENTPILHDSILLMVCAYWIMISGVQHVNDAEAINLCF